MTNEQIGELVKNILGAFPAQRQRMTERDVEGFTLACKLGLEDLDQARAMVALRRVVRTARFLPTIAEIREAAVEVAHGARKNGGEAWGEVRALVARQGRYRTPGVDFAIEDELVAAAVRAFGWSELCRGENPSADRARFIELYDQLARGERRAAQIAPGATSKTLLAGPPERKRPGEARALIDKVTKARGAAGGVPLVVEPSAAINDDDEGEI